jgi:phosphate acetyltransferase
MAALDRIIEIARRNAAHVVLCEADDPRVLRAALRSSREGTARITLIGARERTEAAAAAQGLDLSSLALVDPERASIAPAYAQALFELRKHKGMTLADARNEVRNPLCFANMMVRQGHADASVAGAVYTTAEVVRSAIQIIGLDPSARLVSSFFLMVFSKPHHPRQGGMVFADCALVVDPNADELAQIAIAAADNARRLLQEEPRVAMLSFSTAGSASHASVTKVIEAARRVKAARPDIAIDEDIQLDAALIAEVADRKVPGSRVGGRANVLVFPTLEAGNIGYKLAERIGGATAIGPILQGLARPVSDLSRGCSEDDVFQVIAVISACSSRASTAGATQAELV